MLFHETNNRFQQIEEHCVTKRYSLLHTETLSLWVGGREPAALK